MNIKNTNITQYMLLAPTILIAAISTPAGAQEQLELRLDCYSSEVDYRGSRNTIDVKFLDVDHKLFKGDQNQWPQTKDKWSRVAITLRDSDCAENWSASDIFTFGAGVTQWAYVSPIMFSSSRIRYIQIKIRGSDAFWLDRMQIVDPGGQVVHGFGVNMGKGFCLSTDPDDASEDWRPWVDQCVPCYEFDLAENAVSTECTGGGPPTIDRRLGRDGQ